LPLYPPWLLMYAPCLFVFVTGSDSSKRREIYAIEIRWNSLGKED
jgi:hypothetical protein